MPADSRGRLGEASLPRMATEACEVEAPCHRTTPSFPSPPRPRVARAATANRTAPATWNCTRAVPSVFCAAPRRPRIWRRARRISDCPRSRCAIAMACMVHRVFFQAGRDQGVRAIVGAEITLEDGSALPLLAATRTGYQNLCQLITEAKSTERDPRRHVLTLDKGKNGGGDAEDFVKSQDMTSLPRKRPCYATWEELARFSEGLVALTGDDEGPLLHAWRTRGEEAASPACATTPPRTPRGGPPASPHNAERPRRTCARRARCRRAFADLPHALTPTPCASPNGSSSPSKTSATVPRAFPCPPG
jgi:hypothetical protein